MIFQLKQANYPANQHYSDHSPKRTNRFNPFPFLLFFLFVGFLLLYNSQKDTFIEFDEDGTPQLVEWRKEKLMKSKYGTGLECIFFIFIAVRPTNTIHQNEASYDPDTRKVTMALKLSYPHVEQANEARILQMMAHLFLVSIDLYEGLSIPDFDHVTFRADVEALFSGKGWLTTVRQDGGE